MSLADQRDCYALCASTCRQYRVCGRAPCHQAGARRALPLPNGERARRAQRNNATKAQAASKKARASRRQP